MYAQELEKEYFEWLCKLVCEDTLSEKISFHKLLSHLHKRKFTYSLKNDKNRALDGVALRRRFFMSYNLDDDSEYLKGPCSVLEMMIGLSIRCEETIMDDPRYGNRTIQWFWGMVTNLGLGGMTDDHYDKKQVDEAIDILLKRNYKPNGEGGLFTVRNCDKDLRKFEIWYQLLWYLDGLI